jgi:ankyrin repeat protein
VEKRLDDLDESTLVEVYMADTRDDKGAIAFINSAECTKEMVNYADDDGWTALNLAAKLNRWEVVEALIKKGADVNHENFNYSMNALMFAIYDGDYYEGEDREANLKTIDLLINAGTDLNFEDRFSAFTLACNLDKIEVIVRLLGHGVNIDFKDEDDKTGMEHLIENKNEDAIRLVENYRLNNKLQEELPSNKSEPKKPKL